MKKPAIKRVLVDAMCPCKTLQLKVKSRSANYTPAIFINLTAKLLKSQ
nr:MAG TPA: hypothetical protein [Caudoviricetes sp.]